MRVTCDSHATYCCASKINAMGEASFLAENPSQQDAISQISAINFGLSAALFGRLDIEDGHVVQKNFDNYPVPTLDNASDILVDVVNSGADIGGVGEIGTPGIAPAVGNAIYAATGTRLRALPFLLPDA